MATAEREWLEELRQAASTEPVDVWLLVAVDSRLAELGVAAEQAANSPVEPPKGAGTPAEPVSAGSDVPGGHWCTVADDLAARLSAAEDDLVAAQAVLARYKRAVAQHKDNGAGWCTGCHSRLTGKCSVKITECRTLAALRGVA